MGVYPMELNMSTWSLTPATVSTIVLLLALIVSMAIPYIQTRMTRKRATLDFVQNQDSAQWARNAIEVLLSGKHWGELTLQERTDISLFLGDLEKLAIGLKHGVYDKTMVRDIYGKTLYFTYRSFERHINDIRAEQKQVQEFMGEYSQEYTPPCLEFQKLAEKLRR